MEFLHEHTHIIDMNALHTEIVLQLETSFVTLSVSNCRIIDQVTVFPIAYRPTAIAYRFV